MFFIKRIPNPLCSRWQAGWHFSCCFLPFHNGYVTRRTGLPIHWEPGLIHPEQEKRQEGKLFSAAVKGIPGENNGLAGFGLQKTLF